MIKRWKETKIEKELVEIGREKSERENKREREKRKRERNRERGGYPLLHSPRFA